MALIKCIECEKEYSDKAKECPNCGCPTISNTITEKRKKIEPCSVEIKGNEKYYPPIGLRALGVGISYIIISIMIQSFIFYPAGIKEAGIIFLIIGIVLVGLAVWIAKKLPGYKKDLKHRNIINEYFQNRFPILESLPQGYKDKKVVTKKHGDQISTMFDIYMEAYQYDADAIVLNDSNVSTHIIGSTSRGGKGSTNSYNTFHITATLVKY